MCCYYIFIANLYLGTYISKHYFTLKFLNSTCWGAAAAPVVQYQWGTWNRMLHLYVERLWICTLPCVSQLPSAYLTNNYCFVSLFQLQSKRELFFKNELPGSGAAPPPPPSNGPVASATPLSQHSQPLPNPSTLKDALNKRGKTTTSGSARWVLRPCVVRYNKSY